MTAFACFWSSNYSWISSDSVWLSLDPLWIEHFLLKGIHACWIWLDFRQDIQFGSNILDTWRPLLYCFVFFKLQTVKLVKAADLRLACLGFREGSQWHLMLWHAVCNTFQHICTFGKKWYIAHCGWQKHWKPLCSIEKARENTVNLHLSHSKPCVYWELLWAMSGICVTVYMRVCVCVCVCIRRECACVRGWVYGHLLYVIEKERKKMYLCVWVCARVCFHRDKGLEWW